MDKNYNIYTSLVWLNWNLCYFMYLAQFRGKRYVFFSPKYKYKYFYNKHSNWWVILKININFVLNNKNVCERSNKSGWHYAYMLDVNLFNIKYNWIR